MRAIQGNWASPARLPLTILSSNAFTPQESIGNRRNLGWFNPIRTGVWLPFCLGVVLCGGRDGVVLGRFVALVTGGVTGCALFGQQTYNSNSVYSFAMIFKSVTHSIFFLISPQMTWICETSCGKSKLAHWSSNTLHPAYVPLVVLQKSKPNNRTYTYGESQAFNYL
jgi:hypothetical protein